MGFAPRGRRADATGTNSRRGSWDWGGQRARGWRRPALTKKVSRKRTWPRKRQQRSRSLHHANRTALYQGRNLPLRRHRRSEEHTSELKSLMRISYAVYCLKKKKKIRITYI